MSKKVAYITGGSKGIGLAIAHQLVKDGYNIVITGRNQDSLNEALVSFGKNPNVLGIISNTRKLEDEQQAIDQVIEKWGQLDVCIANAGVGRFSPIDEMTKSDWDDTIDINLTGVFHSVKASIPALTYNASKFGLVGFSQAIMLDLRRYGIKVTTIMPGSVSTYFNGHIPSDKSAWKIQPEDIGQMVGDLLKMNPRTLPSKVEVRPSIPPSAMKK